MEKIESVIELEQWLEEGCSERFWAKEAAISGMANGKMGIQAGPSRAVALKTHLHFDWIPTIDGSSEAQKSKSLSCTWAVKGAPHVG